MTRNDEGKVVEVQCGQRYCTDVVRLPNEEGHYGCKFCVPKGGSPQSRKSFGNPKPRIPEMGSPYPV